MNREPQYDLTLETSRLILMAGEQVLAYKKTIKDELLHSAGTLKEWVSFFNYNFDEFKAIDFINKTTDMNYNKQILRYFLFDKETKTFVGSIVLQDIDLRIPSCEIGYWTVVSAQGKGYMTEAIQFITRYLIETHQFARIEAYIDVKNSKSIQTIERCNYEREGTLKNSDLSANQSKLINEALYAITTPIHFK